MIPAVDYAELQQLIHQVWGSVERDAYDAVLACLTADCEWERGGKLRVGSDDILASLNERPAGRLVRHQITNLSARQQGDELDCSYLMVAYSNDHAKESAPPYSKVTPDLIVDCSNRCRRGADGWRISEFKLKVLFKA